jgi:hypothetical protein
MLSPSKALKLYYLATFVLGTILTFPLAHWVQGNDIGIRGAALLSLSANILFVMLLPLIMDFAESHYFKAKFLALEEIAKDNPELAGILEAQCQKLSLPGLKLAIVDGNNKDGDAPQELFSYGLWRHNPRLFLNQKVLRQKEIVQLMAPSIEAELSRFAKHDHTIIFVCFAAFQIILQNILVYGISHHLPG